MGGSAAITAQEQSFQFYSAKTEVDDFMRRSMTFVRSDNAAARTTSKAVLHERSLTSSRLPDALEKLDILCSQMDVEVINVIQIKIQKEGVTVAARRLYKAARPNTVGFQEGESCA